MNKSSLTLSIFRVPCIFFLVLLIATDMPGQEEMRPVYQELQQVRAMADPYDSAPFTSWQGSGPDYRDKVREAAFYTMDSEEWQKIWEARPLLLQLSVPGEQSEVILQIYRAEIHSSGYTLHTTRGPVQSHVNDALFYRGIVRDKPNSLAVVSVLSDEMRIMYSDSTGNYRMHRLMDGRYVFFKDADLLQPGDFSCDIDDTQISAREEQPSPMRTQITGNCVEVYFECDYESYQDNGSSVANTEQWIAALFNEVSTLYDNEGIPVSISEVFVWDSPDPYTGLNSTGALLNAFVDRIATYNYDGRLAHLVSTRGLGGGIAYLDVLCSTNIPCAVSASLSTNIVEFPNYSWNVNVVAHEMGHNFGSPHTHDCAWNGNNTAIDGCGPEAGYDGNGNCNDGPLPSSGTIMSYCHIVSGVGINFNNGFGNQPGALILNEYQNASCVTGECTPPMCASLEHPAGSSVDINAILQWQSVPGASGYRLTIGTSSGSGDLVNNLDVGLVTIYDPGELPFNTTIYVLITPYNSLGDATGCAETNFTTEPNTQPACTALTDPADGAVEVDFHADLYWAHAIGNQLGYSLNVGTTPGGGQLINNVDVGNVTAYDPGQLPDDTTIYVQITPYGTEGDTPGCPIENFETAAALPGDFCDKAVPISCGSTVSGNTALATFDDASFCGTSNTAPGIWYTFEGTNTIVTLSTCGQAGYDSKISVYSGSCGDLDCVAGIDDAPGCGQAAALTFTASEGLNYYVLVHGWGTSAGPYDLTMTCADLDYCYSQGNIFVDEWIENFSLADFSHSSGASQYSDYTDMIVDLYPGESYAISAVPGYGGQEYGEYFRVWIDFNQDGDFSDAGEQVFQSGPVTDPVSGAVTVPSTATPGTTRMRISMKWSSYPSACESFQYGEVEDYTVRIKCDLVNKTSDNGPGSLPYVVGCVQPGDTVFFSQTLAGDTIRLLENNIQISQDIVIYADAADDVVVYGQSVAQVFQIDDAVNVEIQDLTCVAGNASSGAAIGNQGSLILRDVNVLRHPGGNSGGNLIYNAGTVTMRGACFVHSSAGSE